VVDHAHILEDSGFADFVLENWHILGNCRELRKRAGKNMVNDSIGDTLIRIKNGYLAGKLEVNIPYSKLVNNLCQLLTKEGYIKSVENIDKTDKEIMVKLKYENKVPVLTEVKRVSKPGLRVYKGVRKLPKALNGYGIAIISTPKGLLTDKEAREKGVGGEVMALVW